MPRGRWLARARTPWNFLMPARRVLQLDVFADRAGAGNPLAVVLDAEGLDTAAMQAIAAWTNVVETTFVLPPEIVGGSYRLRIFTPQREIPFAGHPSLGSAHAWLDAGGVAHGGVLQQDCGAGRIAIRVEARNGRRRLFFRAPPLQSVHLAEAGEPGMERALRNVSRGGLPPALVSAGRRWWLVEFADEAALRDYVPDLDAIAAWSRHRDAMGLCGFARIAPSTAPGAPDYDGVVRAFAPAFGITEDPASGAANATIAAYLRHAGVLPAVDAEYTVSQGRELGRDARIDLRVEAGGDIWVGGEVQTVVRATMQWD
jgi:PhzF family phenazine biosynthesis protein